MWTPLPPLRHSALPNFCALAVVLFPQRSKLLDGHPYTSLILSGGVLSKPAISTSA